MRPLRHHVINLAERRHVIGGLTIIGLLYCGPYLPEGVTLVVFFAVTCMAMTTHAGSVRVALVASLSFLLSLLFFRLHGWKSFAGNPMTFRQANEEAMVLMVLSTLIFGTFAWIRKLLSTEKAELDKVLEACNLYVWIAATFAFLYTLVGRVNPQAFRRTQYILTSAAPPSVEEWSGDVQQMLYYSFVTQTTLGLGDILPVTHIARVLTITQAIIGQFYVAVVLAYILNLWIQNLRQQADKKASTPPSSKKETE